MPCRCLNPSYEANANVQPRRIGPPAVAPNWFRWNTCGSLDVNSKKLRASKALFRTYSNASPWNVVRARARHDIHNRARHVTVLRSKRRMIDLEFLDAPKWRLENERTKSQVVGRDAVDDESDRLLAIARHVDRERADPANRPDGESRLGRRDRGGHKQTEIDEVATVQRNLLHGRSRNDMPDDGRCAIDERDLRRDDHGFRSSANGQTEVAHERAADIEVQVFDHLGTKIERFSDDRIRPRSEGGDVVAPLAIGAGGHFESRCRAPDGDNGLGESCSRNIGHAPLQRRRRLGKRKRGVTEQDRCHQCPVAWCSLPACERRFTTGRDHGRRIGGYEQHLPSDLPGINLAPDPVLHGEFLANRGLVAPASAMPRSTPGHPTGVAQEPSLPAVSLPLAGDARRPSCHA